jgi:hypothetical protein
MIQLIHLMISYVLLGNIKELLALSPLVLFRVDIRL